jgi:RNA-directed DNA polymerase
VYSFDQINQKKLVEKLNTFPPVRRLARTWLKAGVMDGQNLFPTETGVPQGGPISPLFANVALHGLETAITTALPTHRKQNGKRVSWKPKIVRYADDLVRHEARYMHDTEVSAARRGAASLSP